MYTVYIIQSQKNSRYYIGYTSDIIDRLKHHNSGATKSTKAGAPWKVIYTESYDNKRDAWLRERQIKSYKGGIAFKKILGEVA